MDRVRAHLRIRGEVQGVGYRASARYLADSVGVTGWIRNSPDGSVEALLEGDRAAVEAVIDWCRRGPAFAEVEAVDLEWQPHKGEFSRFAIV